MEKGVDVKKEYLIISGLVLLLVGFLLLRDRELPIIPPVMTTTTTTSFYPTITLPTTTIPTNELKCRDGSCTNEELIEELNSKVRPLVGGIVIKPIDDSETTHVCTLGAIVTKGFKRYILTAGHCVTDNYENNKVIPDEGDIGNVVKQNNEIIGQVEVIDTEGKVDATLISINDGIESSNEDFLYNEIVGFANNAEPGTKVYKIGRTTGLTYGTIANTEIYYLDIHGNRHRAFEVIGDDGKFSDQGDSGSAIITVDEPHKIVGILSAGTGSNMPQDIKRELGMGVCYCMGPCPEGTFLECVPIDGRCCNE